MHHTVLLEKSTTEENVPFLYSQPLVDLNRPLRDEIEVKSFHSVLPASAVQRPTPPDEETVLGHITYQARVSYHDAETNEVDNAPAWSVNGLRSVYSGEDEETRTQFPLAQQHHETPYVFDATKPQMIVHSALSMDERSRIRANYRHLGLTTENGRQTFVFTKAIGDQKDYDGSSSVSVSLVNGRLPVEPIPLRARPNTIAADLASLAQNWNQMANRPSEGAAWNHGHLESSPNKIDKLKLWCPSITYIEDEDGTMKISLSYSEPGESPGDWPVANCYYHDGQNAWLNPSLIKGNITSLPGVDLRGEVMPMHRGDMEIHPIQWHHVYMRRNREKTYKNSKGEVKQFVGNEDGLYSTDSGDTLHNEHYTTVPAVGITLSVSRQESAANNFLWLSQYPVKPHDAMYTRYTADREGRRVPEIRWGLEVLFYSPKIASNRSSAVLLQPASSMWLREDHLHVFPDNGAFVRNKELGPVSAQPVELKLLQAQTSDSTQSSPPFGPVARLARGFHVGLGQTTTERDALRGGVTLSLPNRRWSLPSLLHTPLELHAVYARNPAGSPASALSSARPAVRDILLADAHHPSRSHSSLVGLLRADRHKQEGYIEITPQQLYSSALVRPHTDHLDYQMVFFVTLDGTPVFFGDRPHCALRWTRHEQARKKIYYNSGVFA